MKEQISLAQQDTTAIIDELLNDGSSPDALYMIEHHIYSLDFNKLEKYAVEAFKLGYEVTNPEEFEENNQTLFCCDVIAQSPLDEDIINQQIAQLIELSHENDVIYDGWGTYFEDGEDEDDEGDE